MSPELVHPLPVGTIVTFRIWLDIKIYKIIGLPIHNWYPVNGGAEIFKEDIDVAWADGTLAIDYPNKSELPVVK